MLRRVVDLPQIRCPALRQIAEDLIDCKMPVYHGRYETETPGEWAETIRSGGCAWQSSRGVLIAGDWSEAEGVLYARNCTLRIDLRGGMEPI